MADEMVVEKLASDVAELKGYFTETRVPFLPKDKEDENASDIDVLAIRKDKVVAIEVKSHGKAYEYQNYNKSSFLKEVRSDLDKFKQGGEVKDPRFGEIESFDEVWLIFKGHFNEQESNVRDNVKDSIEDFEKELSEELEVDNVELEPMHELIEDLFTEVSEDMRERGVRYSDVSKELARQIHAVKQSDYVEFKSL